MNYTELTTNQLIDQSLRLYVELTNELSETNTDLLNDLLDTDRELHKRKVTNEN
jgi:hypothetical protein